MGADEAVASVYQFSVGGAVLVILVSTGLAATQDIGRDSAPTRSAIEDARSEALLSVALSSSWSWAEGAASLDRGFVAMDGGLKMEAMTLFKGAGWAGLPNDAIDYHEAQAQWGVAHGEDFHLRIMPLSSTTLYDLSGLRVAYIAAWQDPGQIHVDAGTDEQVMAAARAEVDASLTPAAAAERAALAGAGAAFDNRVHMTANSPVVVVDVDLPMGGTVSVPLVSKVGGVTLLRGDVFLADTDHLHSSMAPHWHEYDVVVIGSGADPEALQQGSFTTHLRQHVDAGGLLVLLGGTQDTAWLEQAVGHAVATANQDLRSPDHNHPLLVWPAAARWQELPRGPAVPSSAAPGEAWQHILGNATHVDLALSQQGALQGTAVLTGLSPQGAQGTQLLTNILAYYARQDLHMDFGPSLPDDAAVAGAERVQWGTDAGGNQVALRIQMFYWT